MIEKGKGYEWNHYDGDCNSFLGAGYLFYGKWLAKTWGINPKDPTPAYTQQDGVDYVPADTNVVFGHQFASIAELVQLTAQFRLQFLAGFQFYYGF